MNYHNMTNSELVNECVSSDIDSLIYILGERLSAILDIDETSVDDLKIEINQLEARYDSLYDNYSILEDENDRLSDIEDRYYGLLLNNE